jgi:hypothetical protein
MVRTRSRCRPSRRQGPNSSGKPRGVLHPRVERAGPEHFGIVCFDCPKARSKFLLADFYDHLLIPPTVVTHDRQGLDGAVAQVRQAMAPSRAAPYWKAMKPGPPCNWLSVTAVTWSARARL